MTSTTIPKTMKAHIYASASPTLEANLSISTSVPTPTLSGPNDLLVQVLSASINPADHKLPALPGLIRRFAVKLPATPGMDFSGRVVQTGAKVDSVAVGDLVYGRLEPQQHGTLGEYIVAPLKAVALLPKEGVTVDEAAALGVAGLTAYQTIHPNVKQGDKIFINGSSGGVGTFAVQIAKVLGCHVTASCSPAKADLVKSLGADEIIDYTTTNVSEALKGKGKVFAMVLDNVGMPEDLYKASDDFVIPGGKFVQVGSPMSLDAVRVAATRVLLPSFLGGGRNKYEVFTINHGPDDLKLLGEWVKEKKIRVVIEETYEFEDAPKAFAKLRTGKNAGKLVIHVGK
ncbi:hypothetical protein QBC40DRAFT_205975 [Triangularia verruculosa]|uniref:Enoyl reductase (ER) domain-containing protein n=1 Tax=Triangularia verruculosa TaxID=2587418 RepID=A0AAN7AUJ5_9PEZI|nr:hypothetical protein QBC40DRAFT_205975 [Triangularia verruculosa]